MDIKIRSQGKASSTFVQEDKIYNIPIIAQYEVFAEKVKTAS